MNRQVPVMILLGLALCCGSACGDRALKAELDAARAQKATEERNKQLARDFFAAIDRQDFARLKELLADGFALSDPGSPVPLNADNLFSGIKAQRRSLIGTT